VRDAGLRVVIASSAKRGELEALLKAARVDDLFRETTTSSDVQESKPAPDAVAVALKKIDRPPEQVLMVGDTPYDVESAGAAAWGRSRCAAAVRTTRGWAARWRSPIPPPTCSLTTTRRRSPGGEPKARADVTFRYNLLLRG
jgi:phosphoglycolate phosphatase-like HAD superfamily hydrolase